jgi:hypothetical protein
VCYNAVLISVLIASSRFWSPRLVVAQRAASQAACAAARLASLRIRDVPYPGTNRLGGAAAGAKPAGAMGIGFGTADGLITGVPAGAGRAERGPCR